MTDYFGEPWSSGICSTGHRQDVPVDEACLFCEELIEAGQQGWFQYDIRGESRPVHRECGLREVLGGIGHHENHGYWCGYMSDPDGGRTRRQSALEVWERWIAGTISP